MASTTKLDNLVSNNLKLFTVMVLAFLLLAVTVGVSVFFAVLKGEEQVMVPNVLEMELTQALLELQERELNPRIQLRHSQSQSDRGTVLEQDPVPGMIVKAGRRVKLVVSDGVPVNRVENFQGRDIDNVMADLKAADSASDVQLLSVKQPVMTDYSAEAAGTILWQKPEAGHDISGPVNLEFVVSRGPQNTAVTVPDLAGLPASQAIELAGSAGIAVEFSSRQMQEGETGETVVMQNPAAGAGIQGDAKVSLTVAAPATLETDEIFGIFSHAMPANPFPLPVSLEARLPGGERTQIAKTDFHGGTFTAPYRLPAGSVLVLSLQGTEVYRETLRG